MHGGHGQDLDAFRDSLFNFGLGLGLGPGMVGLTVLVQAWWACSDAFHVSLCTLGLGLGPGLVHVLYAYLV